MKTLHIILITCLLIFINCSKFQRAKWAYQRGNYKKAMELFDAALKVDPLNKKALKYKVLAKSGYLTDKAAAAISVKKYEMAIFLVDEALTIDKENQDASTLLKVAIARIAEVMAKQLIPEGEWERVLKLCDLILKYQTDYKFIIVSRAKAIYHLENEKLTAKSLVPIMKANRRVPNNKFLQRVLKVYQRKTGTFKRLFIDYQRALVHKNYRMWRRFVHPRYLNEVDIIVERFIKHNDPKIKSEYDYFLEVAFDPERYGSPEGAEIVCIEPVSRSHAFVHFTYRKYNKVMKMEIINHEGLLKIMQEEDSMIRKTDL